MSKRNLRCHNKICGLDRKSGWRRISIEAAFTVKTCQDACNVKVQGGLIAKDLNVIRKES